MTLMEDEVEELNKSQSSLAATIFQKYRELKRRFRELEAEHRGLGLRLLEETTGREALSRELEEKRLTERFYSTSGAVADREVLRERLVAREERLASLTALLEAQEASVLELTAQLAWLSSTMATKEELSCKEMASLKQTLDEKTSYIEFLEEKLHGADLLIQELEKLKQNYRLACASLNENMLTYKAQFKAVVANSEKLLTEKEECEKELTEKEAELQKLSVFPQSPRTLVYLSQILHLLKTSEETIADETDHILSYIPSIRRVVESMRSELWGDVVISQMENTKIQTELAAIECFTQVEYFEFGDYKEIQVWIPDEFYYESLNLKEQIKTMEESISGLELINLKIEELNKELERKYMEVVGEKALLEKELDGKQTELEKEKERLTSLARELECHDSLLQKAVQELENQEEVGAMARKLTDRTLDSTIREYNRCSEVLGKFVNESHARLEDLENRWNEDLQRLNQADADYISKVHSEMVYLFEKCEARRTVINDLNEEISRLKNELAEKTEHFKVIQAKLDQAERLFEKIENLECSSRDSNSDTVSDPDIMALESSDKILHLGEKLENQWRTEMKRKETEKMYTEDYVKKIMKANRIKSIQLKKTIKHLKKNVRKIKKTLVKTKNQMNKTNILLRKGVKGVGALKMCCSKLSDEKNTLSTKLKSSSDEVESLKTVLKEKESNYNLLVYEKEKTELVLLNIIKDLEQSMGFTPKTTTGTETDSDAHQELLIRDLTLKNTELSNVVRELENRLENMLNIPEKESSSEACSVSVQTEGNPTKNKTLEIESLQTTIEKLRLELTKEKMLSKKRLANSDRVKQHSDKEISKLIADHKAEIAKLRESFNKERNSLNSNYAKQVKNLNEKLDQLLQQKKDSEEVQKGIVEKLLIDKDEQMRYYERIISKKDNLLEEQQKYYKDLLANKDDEMNREICELKIEIDNIIAKKEEIISKTKENGIIAIKNLKKKFKAVNKKLKNENTSLAVKLARLSDDFADMERETMDGCSQADVTTQACHQEDKFFEDCASQTVFFYTHLRTCDFSVQASVRIVDVGTQTKEEYTNEKGNNRGSQQPDDKLDHMVYGLPSPRKDISINIKEQIKCSIQETNGAIMSAFINNLSPLGDFRDVSLLKDKNELISHVAYLESELIKKTEDFNRNVEMYQDTIRRQRGKVEELESLLSEEVRDTYRLRERLGREYGRAERLSAERRGLQDRLAYLERALSERQLECEAEREKHQYWKSLYENSQNHRKASDELEESLKRLQEKVDTAVKYEKKIMEDFREDSKLMERKHGYLESDSYRKYSFGRLTRDLCQGDASSGAGEAKQEEAEPATDNSVSPFIKTSEEDPTKPELKLVVLKKCEVRQSWSAPNEHYSDYLGT